MAMVMGEKLNNDYGKMTNSKKFPKTRPAEKRYLSPHIFSMDWDIWCTAHSFMNETRDFLPRFPHYGVPNNSLRGKELNDALLLAKIAVEWEYVDQSPPGFHHGPYTDGIGRKPEFVYSENLHKVTEEFVNDPNRPQFRGSHDAEDERAHRAYIQRIPLEYLPEDIVDESESDEEEPADYSGAVKIDPALRKRKRTRSPRCMAAKQPRVQRPDVPERQKGETVGAAENARRLAQGQKPRGRPKKVDSDLAAARKDSGLEKAVGGMGETNVVEKAASPPTASPSSQQAPTDTGAAPTVISQEDSARQALPVDTLVNGSAETPPVKKPKSKPGEGLARNAEREQMGKKKRGRPLGVKNKPKPALEGVTQESTNAEVSGGMSGAPVVEREEREGVDEDTIVVARSPIKRTPTM